MQINGVTSGVTKIAQVQETSTKGLAFDTYLDQALNLWNSTNQLEKEAEQISTDFVLGKTDDIASVMIATEKANVALQFTVKVRDTMLEAFNEIMRMQI